MPAILDAQGCKAGLDAALGHAELGRHLQPFTSTALEARPVSKAVNSPVDCHSATARFHVPVNRRYRQGLKDRLR